MSEETLANQQQILRNQQVVQMPHTPLFEKSRTGSGEGGVDGVTCAGGSIQKRRRGN